MANVKRAKAQKVWITTADERRGHHSYQVTLWSREPEYDINDYFCNEEGIDFIAYRSTMRRLGFNELPRHGSKTVVYGKMLLRPLTKRERGA